MSKKAQKYSKNCFKIKGRPQLYIKDDVLVSFAPLRKTKLIKHTSILPSFNNDRKPYTLTFSLPSSQSESDQSLKQDHQRRVKEALTQIEQIWYPKPRSKHKYCGVCRGYYEDYKEHIEAEKHIESLRISQFQRHIVQFAHSYQQKMHLIKYEEAGLPQSLSQQQIFKCLSTQTLQEGTHTLKQQNLHIQNDQL